MEKATMTWMTMMNLERRLIELRRSLNARSLESKPNAGGLFLRSIPAFLPLLAAICQPIHEKLKHDRILLLFGRHLVELLLAVIGALE